MRFYYLDPGLNTNVGHHANTCRTITSELRRRGIDTLVAASIALIPELKAELGAIPFFEFFTYTRPDPDPIAGWLATFLEGVAATTRDLARLPPTKADDVVFLNSAQPVQLMAIVAWLADLPADRRPRVVVEFGTDAGLTHTQTDPVAFEAVDPRADSRSVLYRYVGQNIPPEFRKNLFLTTFDEVASKGYEFITGYETGVLPLPQQAYAPLRNKSGKRPITISVLGHQREDKGYHLMPEVIPALLERHRDIHFLAHNAFPEQMPDVRMAIRGLTTNPRLIVDERAANDVLWRSLFAQTDIVLCPYRPSRYVTSYSAIAVEALANGIPIVAPANTSLEWFTVAHEGALVTFDEFAPRKIIEAASLAITAYDELAEAAYAAAEKWNSQDRKALLVDRILGKP